MNIKRLVLTLQVATAIMSMTYGVMFTMLDDYRDEYGISESGLGLVLAIGFFAAFVGQITLAPLADRGHAKRMMIMGFALPSARRLSRIKLARPSIAQFPASSPLPPIR